MAALPGSAFHLLNDARVLPSVAPRKDIASVQRRRHGRRAARCPRAKRSGGEEVTVENKFFGERLRAKERAHQWRSDGPGRYPKLRVVGPSMSFSQVPEKPLGLYDPSLDKDACGVGFVADLSGVYSRKTVSSPAPMASISKAVPCCATFWLVAYLWWLFCS